MLYTDIKISGKQEQLNMEKLKKGIVQIGLSIIEIIVGILLLINPMGFMSGIIITAGIVMTVLGILQLIGYFRTKPEEAEQNKGLAKGILFILFGLFCAFRSGWFISTFPIFTVLYGVFSLVSGVGKLQWMTDMLRTKKQYWFVALIDSVITLIHAVLILFNPFASTAVLWTFIAVSLILEAVMDVLTYIFRRKES